MDFHRARSQALAFAAVDLERVAWGWNVALGEEKNARYQSALEDLIRRDEKLEVVSLAYEHEARLMQQEQDFVRARKLALRGAELFPDSPGGKLCRNVVSEIEQKSATINTERVWNAPWPEITVHYRNVTNVYFRAVPYDWEQLIQKRYYSGAQNLSEAERRELIRMKPSLEWSQTLPPTTDYKEKDFRIRAPEKLKAGFYFIIASHDPGFGESENIVSVADVWVSELALITRERAGNLEGFVLEANSGEPLSGVDVDIWHMDNQGRRVRDPKLMTDTNGFFSSKAQQNYGYLVRARQGQREIASGNDISVWNYQNAEAERARAQTVFFTDRALYRPGQTIQYKGICLWVDQSKDNCEVLKGEELTVLFKDMNGKEVARQKHRANDYGSFAGSFTAPRDRVTGNMYLEVSGRAQGQANFRVEEYKRPKFEVTLDPPKRAAKLNEKVSLEGRATSYTGAAVDEAAIRYRVIRQVRMPWWWGWYGRGRQGGESQEIAHGTTTTKTDGSFSIDFVAKPDLKVPEKDEPTFVFEVHADVTDSAGETRSADHSIRAGYTALEVTMGANDWETPREPVRIKVETRSLDGEPQEAHGTIKLYRLKQPETVQRASLEPQYRRFPNDESDRPDLSDPNKWDLGEVADEQTFTTGTNGLATNSFQLAAGVYRALLETRDRFGKKVSGKLPLKVLDPDANTFTVKIPHLLAAPEWELQPGDDFMALWGTGYEEGRAFIEFEHRHQIINRFWTQPGHTQQQLKLAVTEAMRGGFTLHVTQVRENRAYLDSRKISVPWKNKALALKWEHFVSKLQPGQKETWTAVVSGPSEPGASAESERKGGTHGLVTSSPTKAVAEMVATLYDESLDAFAPHRWTERFNVFREDNSYAQTQFGNSWQQFQHIFGNWGRSYEQVTISYRSFPPDFKQTYYWNHGYFGGAVRRGFAMEAETAMPAAQAMSGRLAVNGLADNLSLDKASAAKSDFGLAQDRGEALKSLKEPPGTVSPDLNKVSARKNLNETAFFYPQLTSDSNGVVRMTFTMPEALTRWRFMGFASDQTVRSGYLEDHAVTAKDLMVQPNPPRFLREGDTLEFTVKVSNQSEKPQSGTVRLTFNLALKDESADALLGNTKPEQAFEIPAKESRGFSWRIHVPDACGFLTYKAVAASATVSDGEEGAVPVLSRRILVTETLPLPIRGPATKKFEFAKLVKSGSSKTLENESLTVQMVSNPAWYAVLALPYLMEYPYECSEQVFNRLYANALARNIANSDAKIHRIFEQWRNTPALESPLEKNQDLKAVSLEETPWLRQAESESQARRNVGVLFDDNRLNYETQKTMEKLTQMQLPDGSWPWFPGGQRNEFITLYIVTGFGRLRHLGVEVDVAPAVRSLQGLDAWMTEHYQNIMRGGDPDKYVPSATDALYLYGRSFFLKDMPIGSGNLTAIDFFLKQSRKFWLKTENRQSQGHLAIALSRFNTFNHFNDTTPIDIMKSIKERSVSAEEMGMFWRDTEYSWYWFRAPLETQALMIEAFDEIMQDANTVEECKVWLLKQKQTQDWKTTKATADAVYALLLRGKNVLASDALVEVSVGGKSLTPQLGASSGPQKPNPGKTSAVE
ncbi:MAG TPA: alpha-2-macroglobulin family protein, partial [Candidatus Dormibacteraeota bacterium]|nr:alpha-2-macroglobulin family protein [Candidatus Dormibacteraeota bacterium]